MPLYQQCTSFVKNVYTRRYSVESVNEMDAGVVADESATDKRNRKKRTVPSKRETEKQLIDKILALSGICQEDSTRVQLDPKLVWNQLEKLTNVLKSNTGNILREFGNMTPDTSDKQRLSEVITDLQEQKEVTGNTGAISMMASESIGDNTAIELVGNEEEETGEAIILNEGGQPDTEVENVLALSPAICEVAAAVNGVLEAVRAMTKCRGEAPLFETMDGMSTSPIQEAVAMGEVIGEMRLGGQECMLRNVKVLQVHTKRTVDLYKEGRTKMAAMDLPALEFRCKQQLTREQVGLHDKLYEFENEMGGDFGAMIDNFAELDVGDQTGIYTEASKLGL